MSWMRCSITPPALTASSRPDVAVVSSSSVTPEPVRASRERQKEMEDVILVKFVLLVSVHTTSVNETRVSEASKFHVLLCLIVGVFMESRHKDVWSRPSDCQIIPHVLLLLLQGCVAQTMTSLPWSSSSSLCTPARTASMSLSHP